LRKRPNQRCASPTTPAASSRREREGRRNGDRIVERNGDRRRWPLYFTSLRPTTYDITAELSGFRTSQRKGVLLQANQNLTVNFAIELGTLAKRSRCPANRRPSTSPRRPSAKSSIRNASSSCR
jgi:hypothetical protein